MPKGQKSNKPKGKAAAAGADGGRVSATGSKFPTPKRQRIQSDDVEQVEHDVTDSVTELDPDLLLESLLGCLSKDENLLNRLVQHLFQVPDIQKKLVEQVVKVLDTRKCEKIVSGTGTEPNSAAESLTQSVDKLTNAVGQLNQELKQSKQKYDDLEQYSRRNNIIISNFILKDSESLEAQVCNFLNKYVGSPILTTEIDRAHKILKRANADDSNKPPDIIVKFVSYRTKASILTKEPMVKLREDNDNKPRSLKVFIGEDLTNNRKEIFYKTRTMKKSKHIKDTFPRDGRIIVKINDYNRWTITSTEDLEKMCTKFNIQIPKSKSEQKSSSRVVMDVQESPLPMSQSVLDPQAEVFRPLVQPSKPGTSRSSDPSQRLFSDVLTKSLNSSL